MSEQPIPITEDLPAWLSDLGTDAYALAWVGPGTDPLQQHRAPVTGQAGVARPDFDLGRLALEELVRGGPQAALRRWIQLEDRQRQLAIIGADLNTFGGLREYTPGELTAALLRDPATNEARVTSLLSSWLYRRNAEAPQGLELGWIAAATAWACHMREFTSYPPPAVTAQALANAGEQDDATEALITDTGLKVTGLIDRLEREYRSRDELVEDWRTLVALTADVPVLQETSDWLLDQIALRDAHAQQLRAVLEPDITDHHIDQRGTAGRLLGPSRPGLDPQRAAQLGQARETVRAYTAAAHGGRTRAAQQLLDALPIPVRALQPSGPATAWRGQSFTADDAVNQLALQRETSFAEDGPDYFADPDLLHATSAYLHAREAHLQILHDALGRLAAPGPPPELLPQELADVAAGQTTRRVEEAFGSIDRARQILDGQITYLQQEPVPPHRREATPEEIERLQAVRQQLDQLLPLDEDRIRERLEAAMARPAAVIPAAPASRHAVSAAEQGQAQALTAGSLTPGVQP
ncbi:hypothetical protein [Streptomyces sp. 7N604]|uniref:hypothetical protein n=1 Tax=Streptomyces sp. 7N604 TaxID=3457415 RepID=UPI003FD693CB